MLSRIDQLGDRLRVAMDSGACQVLIPTANAADFASIPPELLDKLRVDFYSLLGSLASSIQGDRESIAGNQPSKKASALAGLTAVDPYLSLKELRNVLQPAFF